MSRYPFTPYPNGWFRIAYSDELKPGEVKPAQAFGKDLVMFRGGNGQVHVMDAHCPHLGANLAIGGSVIGDTIACPFHGWRFDGEGACVEVPYCSKIPPRAKLASWVVREQDGVVFVHFDAEGRPPAFELPRVPEVGAPGWSRFLRFQWRIRMHIQEIAENAVDTAHFDVVHHFTTPPALHSLDIKEHVFRVHMTSARRVLGILNESEVEITYYGLGVVHARVETGPVNLRTILTTTPVDEEHVDVHIAIVFKLSPNPLKNLILRHWMMKEIATDFHHDIPIWEAKQYLSRPLLCPDDGPIGKIRRWASQFYSERQIAGAA